jgi:pimeloyl-ACP methyl ester carboxylesterase
VSDLVRTVAGPVVLVGHSHGGAVISNVPADAGEIVGLVCVGGFAPERGESAITLSGMFPGSTLGDRLQPVPRGDATTAVHRRQPVPQPVLCGRVGGAGRADGRHPAAGHTGGSDRASARMAAWKEMPLLFLFGSPDSPASFGERGASPSETT